MIEAGKAYSMCVDCEREKGALDAVTSDILYLIVQRAVCPNYDGKVRCNKHLRLYLAGVRADLQRQIAKINEFESSIKD